MPGPGQYEIKSKIMSEKGISLVPRPMVTAAKRWVYKQDGVPLPGYYNPCDCFKNRKDFQVSKVPFLSNTERLKEAKIDETPGDILKIK